MMVTAFFTTIHAISMTINNQRNSTRTDEDFVICWDPENEILPDNDDDNNSSDHDIGSTVTPLTKEQRWCGKNLSANKPKYNVHKEALAFSTEFVQQYVLLVPPFPMSCSGAVFLFAARLFIN